MGREENEVVIVVNVRLQMGLDQKTFCFHTYPSNSNMMRQVRESTTRRVYTYILRTLTGREEKR